MPIPLFGGVMELQVGKLLVILDYLDCSGYSQIEYIVIGVILLLMIDAIVR